MKKIFFVALALFLVVIFTQKVLAIDLGATLANKAAVGAGYDKGTNSTSFAQTVGIIISVALSFVGVIFLTLTVYAGYLWMTAGGAEEQVQKAQTIIKQSIIGLVVTVAAYSITSFVVPAILQKTVSPGTPKIACCSACSPYMGCTRNLVSDSNSCQAQCTAGLTCQFMMVATADDCK